MMDLNDMAAFLDDFFRARLYPAETGGVYRASARPVQRLGLALEPWHGMTGWAEAERLDALFLHRPWTLAPGALPDDTGIMAYHLPFDEHLTLGDNPRLASALGLASREVLCHKEGRPLGMLGTVTPQSFDALRSHCEQVFGGLEEARPGEGGQITTVAVVGAMTDALVREAARRGVGLYVTGQIRQPGLAATRETGLGVVAVGHRRSEEWGLRALAGVLRERWHGLEVIVSPHTEDRPPGPRPRRAAGAFPG